MEWITVYSVTYPADAYVIKPVLENEGFEVFLKDELTVQVDNFMSNAIGGIKIQVPKNKAKEAYNFLIEKGLIRESKKSEGFIEKATKNIPLVKNWGTLAKTLFIGGIISVILLVLIVMNSPDFN
jgi:hypothetical protein